MLLTCFPCLKPPTETECGTCMLCQYECGTKACKCSFMHTECLASFNRKRCDVCGIKYCWNLEPCPKIMDTETSELKQCAKRKRDQDRLKAWELRQHARTFVPGIQKLFRTRFTRRTDFKFLIEHVANSPSLCNCLYQRLLDAGQKRGPALQTISYIRTLGNSYDLEHPKLLKTLKDVFINEGGPPIKINF